MGGVGGADDVRADCNMTQTHAIGGSTVFSNDTNNRGQLFIVGDNISNIEDTTSRAQMRKFLRAQMIRTYR